MKLSLGVIILEVDIGECGGVDDRRYLVWVLVVDEMLLFSKKFFFCLGREDRRCGEE